MTQEIYSGSATRTPSLPYSTPRVTYSRVRNSLDTKLLFPFGGEATQHIIIKCITKYYTLVQVTQHSLTKWNTKYYTLVLFVTQLLHLFDFPNAPSHTKCLSSTRYQTYVTKITVLQQPF